MSEKLTTFEKAKAIRNSILSRVGESLTYKSWTDEFRLSNIQDINKTLIKWEEEYGSFKINPTDLTIDEMKELGFQSWDEENPIKLIPIWLYPFLAEEFESESISGSKHYKLSDLDTDQRFGCLAYGVIPSNGI